MSDGRHPVEGERGVTTPEWELFVRDDGPLRYVGSLTAPTAEVAHEQATMLFDDAGTVWLCPASEVHRYSSRSLAARADDGSSGERTGARGGDGDA